MLLIGWKSGARIFSLSQSSEAITVSRDLRNWFSTINSFFHRRKHFGSVIYTKSNFDRGLGKNLYIQISSLVGYFKKANAYLAFFIRFNETVHDKWCLHKSVGQTDNGLECVFDKHWLNSV